MGSWLVKVLRIVCPLALVLLPALVVYGLLSPWPAAENALAAYRGSANLLVGLSYQQVSRGTEHFEKSSRTYAIFPYSLRTLDTVSVVEANGAVHVAPVRFGFVGLIGVYVLCVFGTWWFWIRSAKLPVRPQDGR